ncbi:hypothetical protein E5F34_04800 [Clostridioides difficile]|uniref:hypothetical protein n=1 Tax=Clostridioides difficile TaxID=1496 RepID=UPI00107E6A19|nr:hypothetical protein [Clostridioides difficile]TGA42971.1 hypothetical protein E5F34_04800 [Clostridioides difficile]
MLNFLRARARARARARLKASTTERRRNTPERISSSDRKAGSAATSIAYPHAYLEDSNNII